MIHDIKQLNFKRVDILTDYQLTRYAKRVSIVYKYNLDLINLV